MALGNQTFTQGIPLDTWILMEGSMNEFKWSDWYPPALLLQIRIEGGPWVTMFPWDIEEVRLDRMYWRLTGIAKEWGIENL